ncbi:hypothetical protein B0H13DRAFT_1885537 [Mycena leptocephala]|nr:hypothetical protein B0H13DRAFT_1885537 [Mycena leptocephala]
MTEIRDELTRIGIPFHDEGNRICCQGTLSRHGLLSFRSASWSCDFEKTMVAGNGEGGLEDRPKPLRVIGLLKDVDSRWSAMFDDKSPPRAVFGILYESTTQNRPVAQRTMLLHVQTIPSKEVANHCQRNHRTHLKNQDAEISGGKIETTRKLQGGDGRGIRERPGGKAVGQHRIQGSLRIKGIQAHIERLDLRCKVRGLQQEIKKFPGEVQCLAKRGHINEAWCTAILNTDSKGNGVEKGRLGRVSPRPIYQCTLKERLSWSRIFELQMAVHRPLRIFETRRDKPLLAEIRALKLVKIGGLCLLLILGEARRGEKAK